MEPATEHAAAISWEGSHAFFVSGTEHADDTLQIVSNLADDKSLLTLTLPTLCITYADLAFANAVGGRQLDYPDSRAYGSAHFDPPATLAGERQIRKFTWIRGAQEVTIEPKETVIRWPAPSRLVIPKLHISPKARVKAMLAVPVVYIARPRPLRIDVMQFADGRHVGGVEVFKAHPDWQPEGRDRFTLWARIVDQRTGQPIAQAHVALHLWSESDNRYRLENEWYTGPDGTISATGLPCRKATLTVEEPRYQTRTCAFRAFAGQTVKRVFQMVRRESP